MKLKKPNFKKASSLLAILIVVLSAIEAIVFPLCDIRPQDSLSFVLIETAFISIAIFCVYIAFLDDMK